MATTVLILGESGSGKSTSMRQLPSDDTLLIQVVRKRLPFRAGDWNYWTQESKNGNIFVSDAWAQIIDLTKKTRRKRIVIDDFQYILSNEFMRRSEERGYDKFTEIGKHTWEIFNALMALPDDVRVYILSHTDTSDDGTVRMKTIGKMLNDKVTLEGLVTICLRSYGDGENYRFATRTNGHDPCKTPIDMFAESAIPNDLLFVDEAICQYYSIDSTNYSSSSASSTSDAVSGMLPSNSSASLPPGGEMQVPRKKKGLSESSAATGIEFPIE